MKLNSIHEFGLYMDALINHSKFHTTYKLALIMSITNICQNKNIDNNPLLIDYDDLADEFVRIYWQSDKLFLTSDNRKIILRHGINLGQDKITHFISKLKNLTNNQDYIALDKYNKHYHESIKEIAQLIKNNPVKYLQDEHKLLFIEKVNGIKLKENIALFFKIDKNIIDLAKNKITDLIINNPNNKLVFGDFKKVHQSLFNHMQ